MGEMVDGEYQKLVVSSGEYHPAIFLWQRSAFAEAGGTAARTRRCGACVWAGTIRARFIAAYKAAVEHKAGRRSSWRARLKDMDWVKRAKGRTSRNQQKKLNEDELREFRSRFGIPLSDEALAEVPFYPSSGR